LEVASSPLLRRRHAHPRYPYSLPTRRSSDLGNGAFAEILRNAQRPIVIVGEGAVTGASGKDVLALAAEIASVSGALTEEWNGFADRKSTRLNSSHVKISYAVFCLKKKTPRRK